LKSWKKKENLIRNAEQVGKYWIDELKTLPNVQAVRGNGLIIGFDLPENLKSVRNDLLLKHHIFTGEAKPNTIRLLPSLALKKEEASALITALHEELK
jgi:acetylornithine/N-succinyldiaminopimelate aminotransferase